MAGVTQRSSPRRQSSDAVEENKRSAALQLQRCESFSKKEHDNNNMLSRHSARYGCRSRHAPTRKSLVSVASLFALNVYLFFAASPEKGAVPTSFYPIRIQTRLPQKSYLRPRLLEEEQSERVFASESNANHDSAKEQHFVLPRQLRLVHDSVLHRVERLDLRNIKIAKHRKIKYKKHSVQPSRPADPLPEEGCELLADWQVGHHPTCSQLHELDLTQLPYAPRHLPHTIKLEASKLVAQGSYRDVWMVLDYKGSKVALKTLLFEKRVDDYRNYERHRMDAVAMEQLTSSPHVSNVYGFCGNSVVVDFADGGDLNEVIKETHTPRELAQIGYDLAASVADAHHLDDRGRATMVHTDLNPNNWVLEQGRYKLNDFNRAEFVTWNVTSDEQCLFYHGRAGGQWRSPEEYRHEGETEKVDVYSVGNTLHFILVPNKHKYWPGYLDYEPWIAQVANNTGAIIPRSIRNSTNPYTAAMVQAIDLALEPNPKKRASARQVANVIKKALEQNDKDDKADA